MSTSVKVRSVIGFNTRPMSSTDERIVRRGPVRDTEMDTVDSKTRARDDRHTLFDGLALGV